MLNLDKTVTSLLVGVGIIGLALGFAFQDIVANFISGVIIAIQQPFKKGDLLETNSYFGRVHKISLRTTDIHTMDGLDVIIPNKDVLQNPLINYTKTPTRRVELNVGISYSEDLEAVKKMVLQIVMKQKAVLADKPVEFFYIEFWESSINFRTRFWVESSSEGAFLENRCNVILSIKKNLIKQILQFHFQFEHWILVGRMFQLFLERRNSFFFLY